MKYYEYSELGTPIFVSEDKETLKKYCEAWEHHGVIRERKSTRLWFWFIKQHMLVLKLGINNKYILS